MDAASKSLVLPHVLGKRKGIFRIIDHVDGLASMVVNVQWYFHAICFRIGVKGPSNEELPAFCLLLFHNRRWAKIRVHKPILLLAVVVLSVAEEANRFVGIRINDG